MESWTPAVPFKAKAAYRHHIPKQRHRVTNWAEYDAGLRARGSLTVWFTPEAVAAWAAPPRTSRGGQPSYSGFTHQTALITEPARQPPVLVWKRALISAPMK